MKDAKDLICEGKRKESQRPLWTVKILKIKTE